MPELIVNLEHNFTDDQGRHYFVNVVAEPVGSSWESWLEFVPTDDCDPLLTGTETHQTTPDAIRHWANNLDDVYVEGAFRRATSAGAPPVTRRPVTPIWPSIDPDAAAVLDPFDIYDLQGKTGLRVQVSGLTRTELLTIIDHYDLDPAGLSLARLTASQLVIFILTAVEVQVQQGRHQPRHV